MKYVKHLSLPSPPQRSGPKERLMQIQRRVELLRHPFSGMGIKLLFATIILALALSSCKVYPPVYKRVENFKFEKLSKEGFKVSGEIVMYNPNKNIPLKLHEILMNVQINGKHVATAGQLHPVAINNKSEFSIPLNLTVNPDMTLMEGLQNIFDMIKNREMTVTVEGTVVIKALGIKIPIPIKETEKVDLTRLK
jgi:LEA14-like dessication related protein